MTKLERVACVVSRLCRKKGYRPLQHYRHIATTALSNPLGSTDKDECMIPEIYFRACSTDPIMDSEMHSLSVVGAHRVCSGERGR